MYLYEHDLKTNVPFYARGYIYIAVAINKADDKDYFQIFSLYYDTSTPTVL